MSEGGKEKDVAGRKLPSAVVFTLFMSVRLWCDVSMTVGRSLSGLVLLQTTSCGRNSKDYKFLDELTQQPDTCVRSTTHTSSVAALTC